jgi:hypothetical protein
LIISKSTNSWSCASIVYLGWSNFGFPWCEYDYGTSCIGFTCALISIMWVDQTYYIWHVETKIQEKIFYFIFVCTLNWNIFKGP